MSSRCSPRGDGRPILEFTGAFCKAPATARRPSLAVERFVLARRGSLKPGDRVRRADLLNRTQNRRAFAAPSRTGRAARRERTQRCRQRTGLPRVAGGSTRAWFTGQLPRLKIAARVDWRTSKRWTFRLGGGCDVHQRTEADSTEAELNDVSRESVTLGAPCQHAMETRRGCTANERISLPAESAARHCGNHCQRPRRDVRTVATCRRRARTALASVPAARPISR